MTDGSETFDADARVVLFGHEPSSAQARIRPRGRSWRLGGAVRTFALSMIVAPVVGLIPPHAPWAIGALMVGGLLARRRWSERFTLEHVRSRCPRCEEPLSVKPARLRDPHPISCEGCHHQGYLEVPPNVLAGHISPPD